MKIAEKKQRNITTSKTKSVQERTANSDIQKRCAKRIGVILETIVRKAIQGKNPL